MRRVYTGFSSLLNASKGDVFPVMDVSYDGVL